MARRKKTAKTTPVFWLVVVPLAALAVSGLAIYKGIHYYLTSSAYFRVHAVTAVGVEDERYVQMIRDELIGANIFKVDVVELARRIRRKFPTFYEVHVRRILPSELRIEAQERVPVAVIVQGRPFIFDAEGVALAAVDSSQAVALPRVEGVADRLPKIRTGLQYGSANLRRALTLASALDRRGDILTNLMPAGAQEVSRIAVGANGQLSFYLGRDLEVKMRDRRFEEQLDLLLLILRNLGGEITTVAYVDLRPKEPVVGTKAGGARR
ncbi:MAG: cell division protein FtsQ/DivIB [Deltaproteobacteria bacterium]